MEKTAKDNPKAYRLRATTTITYTYISLLEKYSNLPEMEDAYISSEDIVEMDAATIKRATLEHLRKAGSEDAEVEVEVEYIETLE